MPEKEEDTIKEIDTKKEIEIAKELQEQGIIEVQNKIIRKFGTSGHVPLPKKHIGKRATIIIFND